MTSALSEQVLRALSESDAQHAANILHLDVQLAGGDLNPLR